LLINDKYHDFSDHQLLHQAMRVKTSWHSLVGYERWSKSHFCQVWYWLTKSCTTS